MKFRRLRLAAFGPFTDRVLDFSTGRGPLHVIYGLNEAGKSTALRAVQGLLFGIPRLTPDAHVHPMKDLRIGACLELGDGTVLELVRRKGNQRTLLDASEAPVEEGVLTRALGGVSQELFATMFGLDHVTLRQGGEALLQGKGHVGESLFAAGIGGGRLHRLLVDLQAEADSLYAPRAKNKPLNEAIHKFEAARDEVRDLAQKPEAWNQNERAIAAGLESLAALDKEQGDVRASLNRTERAKRVLPLLAQRARLVERRATLGEVPHLAESAAADREAAERDARESESARADLMLAIDALAARREGLSIPASLVQQEVAMDELAELLGRERKAAADRPKREAELRQIEEVAAGILRGLGRTPDLSAADGLRIDPARRARIARLGLQKGKLDERRRQTAEALGKSTSDLAAARSQLATIGAPRDGSALAVAVEGALRDGDLGARLVAEERALSDIRRRTESAVAALGLWRGELEELPRLQVPLPETVDRFDKKLASLQERAARIDARIEELGRRAGELERELEELQRSGAVPTEEDLRLARARRDLAWKQVVNVWRLGANEVGALEELEPGASAATLDALYPARVDEADRLADRLRRESDRVARLAALLAERDAVLRESRALAGERPELHREIDECQAAWRAAWSQCGIAPLPPVEMRAWLGRHERLLEMADRLMTAQSRRDQTATLIDRQRVAVGGAITALGEQVAPRQSLAELIDSALALSRRLDKADGDRTQLSTHEQILDARVVELTVDKERADAAAGAWREEWAAALEGLGLDASASPEEANATLGEIERLFRELDRASELRRRIEGIDRDAREFVARAEALIDAHAPDLRPDRRSVVSWPSGRPAGDQLAREARGGGGALDGSAGGAGAGRAPVLSVDGWIDAAERVRKRYEQGRRDQSAATEIEGELENKRDAVRLQSERLKRAEQRLEGLRVAAGASDLEELRELERRSQEARSVERDLRAIEGALLAGGDGASVDALIAETRGFDTDGATAEAERLKQRLEDIQEERERIASDVARSQAGLTLLEERQSAAVDAAVEAQQHLARARNYGERYVRAHLAATLLAREIERYRERNQGPLLARAGVLFQRLTGGSFQRLRTAFNEGDEAVLRCVREDGRETEVEGLSDGTRDQLYLALRVASLERYCLSNQPLPLLLDDVLIHFDDARAREALAVLGELASRMQVLYFTHHRRDLDLARAVLSPSDLSEHAL